MKLAEEALQAIHLAMHVSGTRIESLGVRALCKAVHLSPASVQSWTRLGAAVADSSAQRSANASEYGTPSREEYFPSASAALAETCFVAAEKQAASVLLGKARGVGGGVGVGASGDTAEVSAEELSEIFVGVANSALCSGRPGTSEKAVKAAVRALHVYPGEVKAWRCLGAALVGVALGVVDNWFGGSHWGVVFGSRGVDAYYALCSPSIESCWKKPGIDSRSVSRDSLSCDRNVPDSRSRYTPFCFGKPCQSCIMYDV